MEETTNVTVENVTTDTVNKVDTKYTEKDLCLAAKVGACGVIVAEAATFGIVSFVRWIKNRTQQKHGKTTKKSTKKTN